MSEGKTIKEHIIYYMQNGEAYYDKFMCYDFQGRDVCKKVLLDCFQDYVIHNECKLSKCMDETKRIYRNMYSNIRKALIENKTWGRRASVATLHFYAAGLYIWLSIFSINMP